MLNDQASELSCGASCVLSPLRNGYPWNNCCAATLHGRSAFYIRDESDIFRVGEGEDAGRRAYDMYGLRFTNLRGAGNMGMLLKNCYSHPGYALNMIVEGHLRHMIYHELQDAAESEHEMSILKCTDIAYMVDFHQQRLKVRRNRKWMTIPLLSKEVPGALNQAQDVINFGPAGSERKEMPNGESSRVTSRPPRNRKAKIADHISPSGTNESGF
jgi:hypothetical protein